MRKWKRRAAPSGAGVAASQHLLHLEERVVVVLLVRGREGGRKNESGWDTHQMISWKGTETKLKNGDRITLELQNAAKQKTHAFGKKL